MEGGFEIYGEDGILQVSHRFFNFSLKATGLLTVSGEANFFSIDLPLTASAPLLAFRSETVYVAVHSVQRSGNNYTYRLNTSGSGTFQWLLFDKIGSDVSPSDTRCGRQVWGPDGTLAFDSGIPVLKILGIISNPIGYPPDYKVADLPYGTYGFVLNDSGVLVGFQTRMLEAARVSSNAVYRNRISLPSWLVMTARIVLSELILLDLSHIPWGSFILRRDQPAVA